MKGICTILAGLLLCGNPALAAVMYTATPPELSFFTGGIGSWSPFPLNTVPSWECDFNGDGRPEVLISSLDINGIPIGGVDAYSVNGVEILAAPKLGQSDPDGLAVPLIGGDMIDENVASLYHPDLEVQWGDENFRLGKFMMLTAAFNIGQGGTFLERGYLGVRFQLEDGWHYGWIYAGGDSISLKVFSYAWETEPGKGIIAGAIPEPATTGLLALAAVSVFWRKRQGKMPLTL